jgi:hypothetical protein
MLGGVAAGWLVADRAGPASRDRLAATRGWLPVWVRASWRQAAVLGGLGVAPDLDLLAGTHSTYTHSVGAVALVFVAALLWTRAPRLAAAAAAAWGSHILLDWLGSDTTPPIGIMALWPFTDAYYQSPFFVFMAISRRYWQPGFLAHNTLAALREVLILLPIAAAVGWRRLARVPQKGSRHPVT